MDFLEALPERMASLEVQILQFREEVKAEFSAMRQEFRQELRQDVTRLESAIREGDEETRRFMRVLHEDVIERIARIGEQFRSRKR